MNGIVDTSVLLTMTKPRQSNQYQPFIESIQFHSCCNYQVVREVRATHILLNCGKIIIAFIECTDLHQRPHAASDHPNFVCFYKKTMN